LASPSLHHDLAAVAPQRVGLTLSFGVTIAADGLSMSIVETAPGPHRRAGFEEPTHPA